MESLTWNAGANDTRPAFLILARKDYAFSIPPGYNSKNVKWTAACESSCLGLSKVFKVGDCRILDNGYVEFRDRIAHCFFHSGERVSLDQPNILKCSQEPGMASHSTISTDLASSQASTLWKY
ncbi:hypothetical protein B0H10DRAFT_1002795 [Mycena sp. CBHHK59/15]|nr:hypothetical protein B0H10DRAFT_1002795 [Mycena sp. CBHHK59/15]